MTTAYKPAFRFAGQETLCTNAQVFATKAEAAHSAEARFQRWTMPIGWDVIETEDPVNYRWDDEKGDVSV